ncbi:MAG: hypothetical protein PF689_12710 [Deltaproteobacteria bacterium]|jgi:Tfp pilus assembly protein PilN|nr:hypothetical protein [Deltaproteobacteria bacterium]
MKTSIFVCNKKFDLVKKLFVFALLFLSLVAVAGCTKYFASRSQFDKIDREAALVEEELADADLSAQKRYKVLSSQLKEIKSIKDERQLFQGAMNRMSTALFQDIKELTRAVADLTTRMDKLEKKAEALLEKRSRQKQIVEKKWDEKIKNLEQKACKKWPGLEGCR